MPKRKFKNYEDEEDQDYQDDEGPELDRMLQSGAPLDAPRPPLDVPPRPSLHHSEGNDEERGGDGNDAAFEDNTDDVDDSKVRPHFSVFVSMCSQQVDSVRSYITNFERRCQSMNLSLRVQPAAQGSAKPAQQSTAESLNHSSRNQRRRREVRVISNALFATLGSHARRE